MRLSDLGPVFASETSPHPYKMACEPRPMSVDSAVLAVLSGEVAWAIDADVLTLDAGNAGLVFRSTP